MDNTASRKGTFGPRQEMDDVTGQKFAMYRVTSFSHTRSKGKSGLENCWNVVCEDCGYEKILSRGSLYQAERTKAICKHWKDHLIGRVFTRLTVTKKLERGKHGVQRWECLCECGKTHIVNTANLIGNATKSCGCWLEDNKYHQRGVKRPETSLGDGIAARNKVYAYYRYGATKRGYSFELTLEQCISLFQGECHYCGISPSQILHNRTCVGTYTYNGIDRVDNTRGYSIDNVVPACGTCNRAKLDTPYEEFMEWITRVYSHLFLQAGCMGAINEISGT